MAEGLIMHLDPLWWEVSRDFHAALVDEARRSGLFPIPYTPGQRELTPLDVIGTYSGA